MSHLAAGSVEKRLLYHTRKDEVSERIPPPPHTRASSNGSV